MLQAIRENYHLRTIRDIARSALARPPASPFVVIHRNDPTNVGDRYAGPYHYFKFLNNARVYDIRTLPSRLADHVRDKYVILGGGGLLCNNAFEPSIQRILNTRPIKTIIWGAGINRHGASVEAPPTEGFDLAGVRDFVDGRRWVPCSSCMANDLEMHYEIRHEVVAVLHTWRNLDEITRRVGPIPVMNNCGSDLSRVLAFLGSGEVVLTNSYHAAYWGTLLGRRVIVMDAFSNKFNLMRHPPVFATSNDWRTALGRTVVYPDALEECRDANLRFASEIQSLALNLN